MTHSDKETVDSVATRQEMERQNFYFGVLTSVITIFAFLAGIVWSGETRVREIIASIVVLAACDSMSDAYGLYISNQATQHYVTDKDALLAAFYGFISKFVTQLLFAVPFLGFIQYRFSILISFLMGIIIVAIASYNISKYGKHPYQKNAKKASLTYNLRYIATNLLFTFVTVFVAVLLTHWIKNTTSQKI
jgi:VIT1/CCC1 family predicted Fe2+/Mn2+ transporter